MTPTIAHTLPHRPKNQTRTAERRTVALPARLMWRDQRGTERFASVVARNVSGIGNGPRASAANCSLSVPACWLSANFTGWAVTYSFTNLELTGPNSIHWKWIGLDNYTRLFTRQGFLSSLWARNHGAHSVSVLAIIASRARE